MYFTITIEWLRNHYACNEGRQWFKGRFGDGPVEITPKFGETVMAKNPMWWGWLLWEIWNGAMDRCSAHILPGTPPQECNRQAKWLRRIFKAEYPNAAEREKVA